MINGRVAKHWSRVQATRAPAEALGMQWMTGLGLNAQVCVWTDSNAKAIASRRGFGKTKHVELKCLWLQEVT